MTFDRIDDMLRPKWPFGPPSPAGGAAGPAGGEPPCPQGGRGPGIQSLGLSTGDCFWRLWRRPRSRPKLKFLFVLVVVKIAIPHTAFLFRVNKI